MEAVKAGVADMEAEVAIDVGELAELLTAHLASIGLFSPIWMRLWTVKVPDSAKFLPHSLQGYGFSPEWIRLRVISELEVVNLLPYSSRC